MRYPESTKQEARDLHAQGISCNKIAQQFGTAPNTVCMWVNQKAREKNKQRMRTYSRDNSKQRRMSQLKYERSRRKNDPTFKVKQNLRTRLRKALQRGTKTGSAVRDLGCSIDELKTHLESQFQEGMSWENYGEWHIDHIKPLAKFDLTDREQFLQACHYTNLQPLWADDNISKGDK